jgi:hypothetical protein
MFRNRLLNLSVAVALGVVAVLTVRLALATTDVVTRKERAVQAEAARWTGLAEAYADSRSERTASAEAARWTGLAQYYLKMRAGDAGHIPSYRDRRDECFDVPIREAASCGTSQGSSFTTAMDSNSWHRRQRGVCFDLPISQAASCDQ